MGHLPTTTQAASFPASCPPSAHATAATASSSVPAASRAAASVPAAASAASASAAATIATARVRGLGHAAQLPTMQRLTRRSKPQSKLGLLYEHSTDCCMVVWL